MRKKISTLKLIFFITVFFNIFLSTNLSAAESCNEGIFTSDAGAETKYMCNCGKPIDPKWVDVGKGCYHKIVCSKGEFTNENGAKVLFTCGCTGVDTTGWVPQTDGCFHKLADSSSGNNQTPVTSAAGETTIDSAKSIPDGSLFKASKFAGVFDPRNQSLTDFKMINIDQTSIPGIGMCLTANDDIGFSFSAKNQNEIMASLKLAVKEAAFFKVVIPPGVSEVKIQAVSNNWGSTLTSVVAPGKQAVDNQGQSLGRFHPLYSIDANSAIVASGVNQKETYASAWFYNKNTQGTTAVSLVSVSYKIGDYNLYNQWIARTTGKLCRGASSTASNVQDFFGQHFASLPLPVSEDVAFKTQNQYRELLTKDYVTVLGKTSESYYNLTRNYACAPWKSQTTNSASCIPDSFWKTSTGSKKARILIPPGVSAVLDLHAAAVTNGLMYVGVHSTPNVPSILLYSGTLSPSVQFMEGFQLLRQNFNVTLQLVKDPGIIVPGSAQPINVNLNARFAYITIHSDQGKDYPIAYYNVLYQVYKRDLFDAWLKNCKEADLNKCVEELIGEE